MFPVRHVYKIFSKTKRGQKDSIAPQIWNNKIQPNSFQLYLFFSKKFCFSFPDFRWERSASLVSRLGAGRQRYLDSSPGWGQGICFSPRQLYSFCGPPNHLLKRFGGAFSMGVEWPSRETGHSSLYIAEFSNESHCNSAPSYTFMTHTRKPLIGLVRNWNCFVTYEVCNMAFQPQTFNWH